MKKIALIFVLLFCFTSIYSQQNEIDRKVKELLQKMTLEEKIGQLNQYSGDSEATGPITINPNKQSEIKNGQLGSMLNVKSVEHTQQFQELAMQSRLKIPLLFRYHQYKVFLSFT